jgi:hypothetical protein
LPKSLSRFIILSFSSFIPIPKNKLLPVAGFLHDVGLTVELDMKKAHVRTIALPLFAFVLVITTVLLAQTGDSIWRMSSGGEIVPSSSPLQRSAPVVLREPAFSPTAALTPGNLAVFVVAASQANTGGAIVELNTNTASQTPGNVISIQDRSICSGCSRCSICSMAFNLRVFENIFLFHE